jgi:hypothetical protein
MKYQWSRLFVGFFPELMVNSFQGSDVRLPSAVHHFHDYLPYLQCTSP